MLFDIVFGQQGDKGGPLVINDTRCLLAPVLIYENINQLPSVSGVSASDACSIVTRQQTTRTLLRHCRELSN